MRFLRKIKDKIYYHLVEKKPIVRTLYQAYVDNNKEYHKKHRIKSWKYMISLNMYYRKLAKGNLSEDQLNAIKQPEVPAKVSELPKPHKVKNNPPKEKTVHVRSQPVNHKESPTAAPKVQEVKPQKNLSPLPYFNGAESTVGKRPLPVHFARELLQYDVISFDVLDTLILRPFSNPADLFMLVGNELNQINFINIRIGAEKEAREYAKLVKGNNEVTIYDIYKEVEKKTGIPYELGAATEFRVEKDLCSANPYIMRVFKLLKAQNKKIIATSDMYFPKVLMEELLESCGYCNIDEIFVSCDWQCSKRSKGLYAIILRKVGISNSIVHIGDNYTSDIKHANEMHINTRYYKNVHEIGAPFRPKNMSELSGSAYKGIVNIHLHNGLNELTPHYEYGYLYGGFYILGFCNWIYNNAKKNNINKVLFLSRDGVIYQRIFNMLYDDMPNEYFYWSRIANIKYALENDKNSFLTQIVDHKAVSTIKITISSLFNSLGLENLIQKLYQSGLHEDMYITPENSKVLRSFFTDHWDELLECYAVQLDILKNRLSDTIGKSDKIAIVDVGWVGSGPLGLKYLIEEKWQMHCEVYCYIAASRHVSHVANLNEIMQEKVQPYIFSRIHNRDIYNTHVGTNKNTNCIYFEFMTQACSPSYKGFKKDGSLEFDIPEVENYEIITQIHNGIYDFCKQYKDKFKKYPYMLNISGYDAYQPFSIIIKNLSFIKKYFSEFAYAREISGDEELQVISTIKQILKKCNL